MQEVWISGTDWDDQINENIMRQIDVWFDELSQVSQIHVPRKCEKSNPSYIQ